MKILMISAIRICERAVRLGDEVGGSTFLIENQGFGLIDLGTRAALLSAPVDGKSRPKEF
jgi:hypothetical protein